MYQDKKEEIDSFTGQDGREFPADIYDLLNLASDVEAYSGGIIPDFGI